MTRATVDLSRQTYLTAKEAAEYLRHPSTKAFLMWARRHHLPCCRETGRRLLYRRKDLDAAVTPSHLKALPFSKVSA